MSDSLHVSATTPGEEVFTLQGISGSAVRRLNTLEDAADLERELTGPVGLDSLMKIITGLPPIYRRTLDAGGNTTTTEYVPGVPASVAIDGR